MPQPVGRPGDPTFDLPYPRPLGVSNNLRRKTADCPRLDHWLRQSLDHHWSTGLARVLSGMETSSSVQVLPASSYLLSTVRSATVLASVALGVAPRGHRSAGEPQGELAVVVLAPRPAGAGETRGSAAITVSISTAASSVSAARPGAPGRRRRCAAAAARACSGPATSARRRAASRRRRRRAVGDRVAVARARPPAASSRRGSFEPVDDGPVARGLAASCSAASAAVQIT